MSLSPGARLGPYEITAPLGSGGMGEVYRARDTRLGREVAVKILPARFTRDPDRLARFEQEAKAAAALTHPNIVAVFDVGVDRDSPYVVSELLEGQTLREALARGALSPRVAVDLGVQVAHAMAAAHQKGIVHRDLKPENVFVTADGRAKILDFGLAKLTETFEHGDEYWHAPTVAATLPGTVLGTAGYMSPEQVRGEHTDHRTDIFAFGAVFYEMLSGRRAFTRDTAVETMTAVLKEEPPDMPAGQIPTALDRVVRRCLEKNPALRFQSATDVAFALDALAPSTSSAPVVAEALSGEAPGPGRVASGRRWWPAAGIAAALIAGLFIGAIGWRRPSTAPGPTTFQARTFDRRPVTGARFMPDGQTIVYSAAPRGYAPALFVINPGVEAPQPLGLTDAQLLSVSSKGELAILVEARHIDQRLYAGTLATMTLGSSPRKIRDGVREADWSPDGESLAVIQDLGNGRDRLEFPVGTPLYEASGYLSDVRVSRDGDRVAFFEHQWRWDDRGTLKVADRAGRVATLTGEFFGLQGLAWLTDGATLVFSGNTEGGSVLQPMIVPASGTGAPRLAFGVPGRFLVLDVGRDGRWLAVREDLTFGVRARIAGQPEERDLSWLGSSGARSLSRDGEWLLMVDVGPRAGKDYGVVLRKTDGTQAVRLGEGNAQTLSPDGRWASAILSDPARVVVYPTGAGEPVRFDGGSFDRFTSAEWFPDSRRLFICGAEASRPPRCVSQDLAGGPPEPVTAEGTTGTLAPDGRTILQTMPDGAFSVTRLGESSSRAISGLQAVDRLVGWSGDSTAVYVQRGTEVPGIIERVDLVTGQRALAARIVPEAFGVATLYVTDWLDEGRSYVYNYTSLPSTLFVVTTTAH